MAKRIYLVEDENSLRILLQKYLKNEGYDVTTFSNGSCAKEKVPDTPDLWILDIMLPDISGYELIKCIKANNKNTPVIFMSARNEEFDRVVGLELGSDDYLSKPFLPRELVIRTNRLLNRVVISKDNSPKDIILKVGSYFINKNQRTVSFENQDIQLTNREFELLNYLAENKNNLISREQILTSVWGIDYFGSDRVVDDTIRRLRKKVSELTIETVYGYGYKLVDNV
ncbi:response regulator transcription factor [Clostridium sp. MT-14]|uniref:Stage 0 sporulation protein A homolog n=1 Tax=Clostridium aromativorans TaxID=2836848 RepID=A0ABS8NA32_9CLOT|nr:MULTISPECIES: response regulator transcription factor [Clostridium]KAA8670639.1 response regulator transcription factor [Clostridium sp. HV4-5-A1G]MCC9296676.1 response regulator transcription factor [Clostridium aromativorans]CAB1249825.1 folding stress-sensitive two-component response regulator [Clostridiaceae bacterium BL-3]